MLTAFADKSTAFAETLCSTSTYTYEFLFGSSGVGANPLQFTTGEAGLTRAPAWTPGYAITVLDP